MLTIFYFLNVHKIIKLFTYYFSVKYEHNSISNIFNFKLNFLEFFGENKEKWPLWKKYYLSESSYLGMSAFIVQAKLVEL